MRIQGVSSKSLLGAGSVKGRSSWLYEYYFEPSFARTPSRQCVRTERWKYTRYPDISDIDELYDVRNDPHEMRNLAGDQAAQKQREWMRSELFRLSRETEAA